MLLDRPPLLKQRENDSVAISLMLSLENAQIDWTIVLNQSPMAPLKVDCTSGLVIEILYYLNQVGVTSISLLNAHIATKRFILVQRWGFRINMLTPFTAFSEKKTTTQDKSLGRVEEGWEPLDLIELLSLYKIAHFTASVLMEP